MSPVLQPGGIVLKDGLLFATLSARAQGKDVGIHNVRELQPLSLHGMLLISSYFV